MIDKRIIKARVKLVLSRPFYGSLSMRLKMEEWDEDTFATDGIKLFYPKKYPFNDEELITIIAHEALHCALGHLFRRQKREAFRWNIAADFATNIILTKDHFKIPEGGLYDPKYENKTTERIYELLEGKIIKLNMKDILKPGGDGEKTEDGGKGVYMDPNDEQAAKDLEQDWKDALSHAAEKHRGNIPGGLKDILKDLTEPQIPWQQVLFRYLQATKGVTDYTAYPFNRAHLYREIYLPSMRGESIEVCCAIDTSGSMSNDEIANAFSEIRGICSCFGDYTIYFWQCDAAIQEEKVITAESEIPTVIKGRGGTDFRPIFKRIEELNLVELPLIYLTDLQGAFPKSSLSETIWVTEQNDKAPFGTVIKINSRGTRD